MTITKKDCLEFLQTHKVKGEKNEHVYGLFVLVEELGGKWPDGYTDLELSEWILSYTHASDHKGPRHTEINGYSNEEFEGMLRAKSEIKRRDNELKSQKEEHERLYGKAINCRCAIVPAQKYDGPQPKLSGLHNIPPRPFLAEALKGIRNKALAEKVGGGRVAGSDIFNNAVKTIKVGMESINSPTWAEINWSEIEKEYKASKLKAEQEAKQMKERDSNAELKEGGKAVVNNDEGLYMIYGEDLICQEVEIVKFFNHANIDLAVVEFNGSVYCFRKSMLEPVKTERQKAIEFYMGAVSAAMNGSSKGQDWGQHTRTIESLIDSGYLNTKIPPVAR